MVDEQPEHPDDGSPEATPVPETGEDSHRTKGLLRLTMACNERCPFCNVPAEDYDVLTPDLAAAESEVDAFIAAGAATMTVSGGEPTLLKKRLLPLVRRARAGGIRFVEIQTNATLIKPPYAAAMAEAGVTSAFVSFLSHVPELHDQLAGLPGAYDKCLAGIDALLDAGIRVTLNPVTASNTADLVPEFIDFVAERLPRVTFISVSAVQPHGRGRDNTDLLPDYAVLKRTIPEARARAAVHGIELVNPYCGLPLCIGWSDDLSRSVEAFEAQGGGWRRTQGIDNVGNKSHGPACEGCALRTRCGGAWHAYWPVRGGSGIAPPVRLAEPWDADAAPDPGAQQVVWAPRGLTAAVREALAGCTAPTVWAVVDQLRPGDAARVLDSRCTDLALQIESLAPEAFTAAMREVRRLVRAGRRLQPQERVRVWVGFVPVAETNPTALLRAVSLAGSLGVDGVRLLSDAPRWRRVAQLAAKPDDGRSAPLPVRSVRPRQWAQDVLEVT